MRVMTSFRVGVFAACAAMLAQAPLAVADPVTVLRGPTQLPTSGLIIDLPAQAGIEFHVSGSWASNEAGDTFDTRDIIDEIDTASGTIHAGNWVLSGYFTAGDCSATIADVTLENAWTQDATLWGHGWKVRGGVFKFDSALGRRPAAVLCRSTSSGHTLMLYRFLTDQPDTASQSAVMASVSSSSVLAAADRAYASHRVGAITPTHRSDVKNRGTGAAVRKTKLPVSDLSLDLPDDGYFWLISEGDGVDIFDRLLPTLPEMSAELAYIDGVSCKDVIASFKSDAAADHKPTGLPAGWVSGPGLTLDDGAIEMTSCYETEDVAVMFGIMTDPSITDVSELRPLMQAIVAAAR